MPSVRRRGRAPDDLDDEDTLTEPQAPRPIVGVVGGGQLARMMIDAADRAGVTIRVLAGDGETPVSGRGVTVDRGDTTDLATLERFADHVDVITFDHELVPVATVAALEAAGHRCAPSSAALQFSRKAYQRVAFAQAGVPVPPFSVVADPSELDDALAALGTDRSLGAGVVAKASEGGYDGRGVVITTEVTDIEALIRDCAPSPVVLEPVVDLAAEVAVLIATGADGTTVQWDPVDTIQAGGMCAVTILPSVLSAAVAERAGTVARLAASEVAAVGVLAVELFITNDGTVLLNEIAPRPHNSGHITIDVAATSQFENHLRAVAGLPLGSTKMTVAAGVMVNVVGAEPPEDHPGPPGIHALPSAGDPPVHYHRYGYGKSPRPGRKIGHVNFWGDDPVAVRDTAAAFVDISGIGSDELSTVQSVLRSTFGHDHNKLSP